MGCTEASGVHVGSVPLLTVTESVITSLQKALTEGHWMCLNLPVPASVTLAFSFLNFPFPPLLL